MIVQALRNRSTARRWDYLPEFAQEQLPRYTSYPPANRFNGNVGPGAASAALADLPSSATLSLYLHIPYCQKLCWYCGCHTSVPTLADPVESYVDALEIEIAQVAARLPAGPRVTRVHFGGGSPDILTPAQIDRLFIAMRRAFAFTRHPEVAAESDPRGLSRHVIDAFARNGLTRASLGVQVLDRDVQERINRIQPADSIEIAIRNLRAAGVEGINVDMMYGLPGQTTEHVVETATFAAMQDVDRIAVFGYAHVPWMKKHQKGIGVDDLPASEARFRQAEAAARTLEQAGYLPVGFDHFAAPGDGLATADRDGQLRRNFQGYTDDDTTALIGLGASSISSLPGLIYQNVADSGQYREALSEQRSPVARGILLQTADVETARLIERLMCDFEVDVSEDRFRASSGRFSRVIDAGLAERVGNKLHITARGRPYVRNVAACFDPELAPQPGRHSLAV
jgi:oxygen-independent coproporphyrinogen-3 oxidase